LVFSSGANPDGPKFDLLDRELRAINADIIDEHYYRSPEWFLENVSRYDNYSRQGSKIFAGEYAAQSERIASPNNKNNWKTAIAEASFLTGLERNADVVIMASYAPLFAHVDAWQWAPDMIWVDNLQAYGTPNYQVQKLYATNKGTDVVPVLNGEQTIAGKDGYYASATIDKVTNEVIIKISNYSATAREVVFKIDGVKKLASKGSNTYLSSDNLDDVNSIQNPKNVSPKEKEVTAKGKQVKTILAPYSFNVIKFKMG
jgi:alpha-L-arabinofuranosidase